MKTTTSLKRLSALLALGIGLHPVGIHAEDIDLFTGAVTDASVPNILIVLDNTSNWARQSQQWPGGEQQGQSEVEAIKAALNSVEAGAVNVGLLEFVTNGNANQDGAYVRHHVKVWDGLADGNTGAFVDKLDTIYEDINDPIEKRNSNTAYGNLAYDVYNYFGGLTQLDGISSAQGGTPTALADPDGYQTQWTRFRSPLTTESLCGYAYVIYITNPNSSGPATDSSANSSVLRQLIADAGSTAAKLAGASSGTPLPLPRFTVATTTSDPTSLGVTSACYGSNKCSDAISDEFATACSVYDSCSCTATTSCSGNKTKFEVFGTNSEFTVTATNTYDNVAGADFNFDDWAKFLYQQGVPYSSEETSGRAKVVTYTIDVFNKQQNATHTSLMMSAASAGGGRYFAAKNKNAIQVSLESILAEILAVNSSFASAALPVTATNRSENENQVYIPMFRPDRLQKPRWFGNMKRYQIGYVDGFLTLVGQDEKEASNARTGFLSDCAWSFWTTGTLTKEDGSAYWDSRNLDVDLRSQCPTSLNDLSDKPDGPFVEKGGVSEILRKGNTATDGLVNRTIYTRSGSSLTAYTDTSDVAKFIRGQDVGNVEGNKTSENEARIGIHGDVVHSRPLPINYGGNTGVIVFYGSNDGMFRAIDADTGQELWAFLAPEHTSKLNRLYSNSPVIRYDGIEYADNLSPAPEPKDYFFDGSSSSLLYYNRAGAISKARVFTTMRRGGRMIYAFDVTTPTSPALLWAKGCPNLDNDTDCSTNMSGIGQTWSVPVVAAVKGYQEGKWPVVLVGGGYDSCEDADSTTTTCSATGYSAKGRVIYVLAADSSSTNTSVRGTILASFETDGSVPGDITPVDIDGDGFMDYAYAADTRGNVYRINFVTSTSMNASNSWTMTKIAYTSGGARKFLYGPDVLSVGSAVYVALGSGNRERPLDTNYPYMTEPFGVEDRFYMFLDQPSTASDAFSLDDTTYMQIASATADADGASCTTERVEPGSSRRGWYYDYAHRGEQTVTSALIHLGTVTFSTSQAGVGTSETNICTRPLGTARSYRLNLFTGSGARNTTNNCGGDDFVEMAGGGIPPSPVLATVTIDGKKKTVIIGAGDEGIADVDDKDPEVRPRLKRKYWGTKVDN